ncbi:MAG: class I SAM-dependent rRNA methyltransferase [Planctomycetota bacterium]|nr:class I SAM-dependent rRNA methyltransferase [Planctomycetota bacterium]
MTETVPAVALLSDFLPTGPWIYGRQVEMEGALPPDGALVEVLDASKRFVGHALYNGRSDIRLRVLSRGKRTELRNPRDFLLRKLAAADRLRKRTLRLPETTDAYRIVHAEGDDLPGLIVDKLGPALVCEHHALGFWRLRHEVESALNELYPGLPVVHRVPDNAARAEHFDPEEPPLDLGEIELTENGLTFGVRPGFGHKTGWFCDQRDNRLQAAGYANGLDVLDICTNAGGFALNAKKHGARRVRAVDLDEVALERAVRAGRRNGLDVEWIHADGFDVLRKVRDERDKPGLVVLDPHKVVRSRMDLEQGLVKYNDWNTLAIACVRPGGLLFTFSCSGAVDLPTFLGVVFQSARRADREIRLLDVLGASPDHPQRPEFPRSRYLKGALLAVD